MVRFVNRNHLIRGFGDDLLKMGVSPVFRHLDVSLSLSYRSSADSGCVVVVSYRRMNGISHHPIPPFSSCSVA